MRESKRSRICAMFLLLALVVFSAACGKKVAPNRAAPPPPVSDGGGRSTPSIGKPEINSFTAEPSTIEKGQSSTLSWSISNATDMSIDHGVGAVQSRAQRQVFPSASRLRPCKRSVRPRAASFSAIARPMPRLAPVMR